MSRIGPSNGVSSRALEEALGILIRHSTLDPDCNPAVLRVCAVRLLLRMVFVFMAEHLKLLPVSNPVYQGSYALSVLAGHLRVPARGWHPPMAAGPGCCLCVDCCIAAARIRRFRCLPTGEICSLRGMPTREIP